MPTLCQALFGCEELCGRGLKIYSKRLVNQEFQYGEKHTILIILMMMRIMMVIFMNCFLSP